MMLYHYSTWRGSEINKSRRVEPRHMYQVWTQHCILTQWPDMVFLTSDPRWEPSVQAMTKEGRYWEKCGSCPDIYTQLGIPCWRFEVQITTGLIPFAQVAIASDPLWRNMVLDASDLGGNPSQWVISLYPVKVIQSFKWEDDKWLIKETG